MPFVDFTAQTHLVMGAASGIGRAASLRLASLGARVCCLDRDGEGARSTREQIIDQGGRAEAAELNVTDTAMVSEVFEGLEALVGPVHGLVNCAGVTGQTGVMTHGVDWLDFDSVYEVNMRGALLVSQAVLPGMVERNYGRILHVSSISGKEGNAGMAAYSATKAGLIGLVKVMGKEYAETGITVNSLAPAVIRTPILDDLPQSQIDYMTSKIPMGRTGTLDEVSNMIAWIVSRECSFVTGFTFDMSGGRAVY